MKPRNCFLIPLVFTCALLYADPLRIMVAGTAELFPEKADSITIPLKYTDSAVIRLSGDLRFYRGIQMDLAAPSGFLAYHGSLAAVIYNDLDRDPGTGIADIQARELSFEVLPNKILNTWQIPLRASHGLRSSPYITIPTGIIQPNSFPMLFRLMPVIKGISSEMENMVFYLSVKPILGDEGAVNLNFQYPDRQPGKSFIVLIDDEVADPHTEIFLKEGEHHLVILSDDYRNLSSRFIIERAKVLDLTVELQDPTPLLIFESPDGSGIYVDNIRVADTKVPYPVEPGPHEIRFQMSNYSIIRPISVLKGKTYRISLSVDINILEND